jgi:hypothetical protein
MNPMRDSPSTTRRRPESCSRSPPRDALRSPGDRIEPPEDFRESDLARIGALTEARGVRCGSPASSRGIAAGSGSKSGSIPDVPGSGLRGETRRRREEPFTGRLRRTPARARPSSHVGYTTKAAAPKGRCASSTASPCRPAPSYDAGSTRLRMEVWSWRDSSDSAGVSGGAPAEDRGRRRAGRRGARRCADPRHDSNIPRPRSLRRPIRGATHP